MPHCIIEYSSDLKENINADKLIEAVFNGASNSKLFKDKDIKTRAFSFEDYRTGTLEETFVHVVVKILNGRNIHQRSTLSKSILLELKNLGFNSASLTVEVVEIETDSYAKVII